MSENDPPLGRVGMIERGGRGIGLPGVSAHLGLPIPVASLILIPAPRVSLIAPLNRVLPLRALLIVLPYDGVARLVLVTFLLKFALPLHLSWILIPGILPLVAGQRGRRGGSTTVPLIPAVSTLFPVTAPVLMPAWRRIGSPPAEIRGGLAVVAHRDAQDVHRHRI